MARRSTFIGGAWLAVALQTMAATRCNASEPAPEPRPWIAIRGVYGGVPSQIFDRKQTLEDYGLNAVWIGSGGVTRAVVEGIKKQSPGVRVFAEFNTMHEAGYLKDHPDAAPVGIDGERCPAPDGWQGVCPTHPGYRLDRMEAFRRTLASAPIDGIWLDYHHAHASWEQAEPKLPDTCFCPRCLALFSKETGVVLPDSPTPELARRLLGPERATWVQWRCDVFTGWVREFRSIVDATRPQALLGTFHCPWSDDERDGTLRAKLAIDLAGQAKYLDVFSIMTYHARFGHADDPAWISRQIAWLGRRLGIQGVPGERLKIWPIVQLSDWGESVPPSQVAAILDHGTRKPASGVTVFAWSTLQPQWAKVEAMGRFYKAIEPEARP